MESEKKIVIAVACMDYRMHHPESNYVKNLYDFYGADKIYFISLAGPDGTIMDKQKSRYEFLLNEIRNGVKLFRDRGYSNITCVVGAHTECAGHNVEEEVHIRDIKELRKRLNTEGIEGLSDEIGSMIAIRGESDMEWEIKEV